MNLKSNRERMKNTFIGHEIILFILKSLCMELCGILMQSASCIMPLHHLMSWQYELASHVLDSAFVCFPISYAIFHTVESRRFGSIFCSYWGCRLYTVDDIYAVYLAIFALNCWSNFIVCLSRPFERRVFERDDRITSFLACA